MSNLLHISNLLNQILPQEKRVKCQKKNKKTFELHEIEANDYLCRKTLKILSIKAGLSTKSPTTWKDLPQNYFSFTKFCGLVNFLPRYKCEILHL